MKLGVRFPFVFAIILYHYAPAPALPLSRETAGWSLMDDIETSENERERAREWDGRRG